MPVAPRPRAVVGPARLGRLRWRPRQSWRRLLGQHHPLDLLLLRIHLSHHPNAVTAAHHGLRPRPDAAGPR
ncbi:hypothetical protein PAHAL_3G478800 [Panicum hallii]|uniref:Uncharacterized protein n=1 Tax=Panicum hallii TaxID=206008 RepID=A0A2T8KLR0_9POAL|nr:hypothetical protein PAHAL_3G478800 [Panicum hallii]